MNINMCINNKLKDELKCSMGCTEPSAIAFAASYSKEKILNEDIQSVNLGLSSNMLKNALCVTIPNTKLCGISTIVLLGLIKENIENKFQILSDITEDDINKVNKLKKSIKINIKLIEKVDPLYIDIELKSKNHIVKTIIEKNHDNVKECYLDNRLIYSNYQNEEFINEKMNLTYEDIYDFVINQKYDVDLIKKARKYNIDIGEYGLSNLVGLNIGKSINSTKVFNENYSKMISKTVAGIDSRMSGVPKKVIINSGSGNQGIAATVPIVEFAKMNNIPEEKELNALALSHLTAIYIRSKQSRLSSTCGIVIASAGVAAGVAYMLDCDKTQIENAIKNFLCSNFGVLCDGAKVTCALKTSAAVSSAINSAILAKENVYIDNNYGIISNSFENTIDSFSQIEKQITINLDKIIMKIAIENVKNN